MSRNGKVLMAMSGGIDSTVAAVMLKEQGYDVIGITMKTWDYASSGSSKKETGCCSLDSINDARAIATEHGIPHMILDIRSEFGESVIDDFVGEYMAGRTPNPCIMCNTHIKWDALLRRADRLGCDFISTGHYAQVRFEEGRHIISKGIDEWKDQSYVLWGLAQENLARTIFPLGQYHKPEIKQLALDWGYQALAQKPESYEICFIPDNDYRSFLSRRVPDLEGKAGEGDYVTKAGTLLGKHKGYPYYTIGQRKGLDIALGKPMYVVEIVPETNTVVLGEESDLAKQDMLVHHVNLQKYDSLPNLGLDVTTKIRYKDKGTPSLITGNGEDAVLNTFYQPAKGVAPGQSAVWYEGNDVVGGGHIARNQN